MITSDPPSSAGLTPGSRDGPVKPGHASTPQGSIGKNPPVAERGADHTSGMIVLLIVGEPGPRLPVGVHRPSQPVAIGVRAGRLPAAVGASLAAE